MTAAPSTLVGRDPSEILPHGSAFLFVDEILAVDARSIRTARHVPPREPWTDAHFPDEAMVPGVLLLEGMAQTCGLLARAVLGASGRGKRGVLATVRTAKFLRPVRPLERIVYDAALLARMDGHLRFEAVAHVDDTRVAEAGISLAIG